MARGGSTEASTTPPTLEVARPKPSDPLADPLARTLGAEVRDEDAAVSIGRFEVVSKLGEGGMGVVLLAADPLLGRRVALKVLRSAKETSPDDARRRLLREAQGVAKLVHENVVVVHDVGEHEGQVYIAMEYVAGTTLARWQADRPWREVLATYVRAGRGLEAAHAAGLVHRDFKPDNVLVGDDGRVRVTDFGLVSSIGEAPAHAMSIQPSELSVSLTRTGTIMGTPRYMAPEQHVAAEVDERADQFAFCVALYEALYAQRPFPAASYLELRDRVVAGDIAPVPADSEIPVIVREALLRGLRRQPDERHPSMGVLLTTLALVDAPPPRRRRRAMIVGLSIALVGAVALVVGWQRHTAEPSREGGDARSAMPMQPAAIGDDGDRPWALGVSKAQQAHALEVFRAANSMLNDGQYAKAIDGYDAALRDWPHPAIHYNLALALLALHRPAQETLQQLDAALIYPEALGSDNVTTARRYRAALIKTLRAMDETDRGSDTSGSAAAVDKPAGTETKALEARSKQLTDAADRAREAYASADYAAAAHGFGDAFAKRQIPTLLLDAATSLHMLARTTADPSAYGRAIDAYQLYLKADPGAQDRPRIETVIRELTHATRPGAGASSAANDRAHLGELAIHGFVLLESVPPDATIFLDGKAYGSVGSTPWSGELLGTHQVSFAKDGYAAFDTTIGAQQGAFVSVVAELMPEPHTTP